MSKEAKTVRDARFYCPECERDTLVWPGDLEAETRLTGSEARKDAAHYLRCRFCGGQVEVSSQVETEVFPDDIDPKGKVVVINKRQYAAVVRVPGKIIVACGAVNVVLEGDDDELAKIVWALSRNLELGSDGAITLPLPDKVTVALA